MLCSVLYIYLLIIVIYSIKKYLLRNRHFTFRSGSNFYWFHTKSHYILVSITLSLNLRWRLPKSVWIVWSDVSPFGMAAMFLRTAKFVSFISARRLIQHRANARRNSGILIAYKTGFTNELQLLRKTAIMWYLPTLSPRKNITIIRGSQQSKVRIEANIKVFVRLIFCASLFLCFDATLSCLNFLQMAKLHPQMMTVKIAPYDEEIYLAKDSNDWKAEPISYSRPNVHIIKMTVLYPFVVFVLCLNGKCKA